MCIKSSALVAAIHRRSWQKNASRRSSPRCDPGPGGDTQTCNGQQEPLRYELPAPTRPRPRAADRVILPEPRAAVAWREGPDHRVPRGREAGLGGLWARARRWVQEVRREQQGRRAWQVGRLLMGR